jgi:hypothetical protein
MLEITWVPHHLNPKTLYQYKLWMFHGGDHRNCSLLDSDTVVLEELAVSTFRPAIRMASNHLVETGRLQRWWEWGNEAQSQPTWMFMNWPGLHSLIYSWSGWPPTLQHAYITWLQPWSRRQHLPLKRWYLPTRLYGVTTQMTTISNYTFFCGTSEGLCTLQQLQICQILCHVCLSFLTFRYEELFLDYLDHCDNYDTSLHCIIKIMNWKQFTTDQSQIYWRFSNMHQTWYI